MFPCQCLSTPKIPDLPPNSRSFSSELIVSAGTALLRKKTDQVQEGASLDFPYLPNPYRRLVQVVKHTPGVVFVVGTNHRHKANA